MICPSRHSSHYHAIQYGTFFIKNSKISTDQLFFVSFLDSFSTVQYSIISGTIYIVIYYVCGGSLFKRFMQCIKTCFSRFSLPFFTSSRSLQKNRIRHFSSQYQLLMACTVIRSFAKKIFFTCEVFDYLFMLYIQLCLRI
jgi:hypothetical protein